jgi:hypothetical protein
MSLSITIVVQVFVILGVSRRIFQLGEICGWMFWVKRGGFQLWCVASGFGNSTRLADFNLAGAGIEWKNSGGGDENHRGLWFVLSAE